MTHTPRHATRDIAPVIYVYARRAGRHADTPGASIAPVVRSPSPIAPVGFDLIAIEPDAWDMALAA